MNKMIKKMVLVGLVALFMTCSVYAKMPGSGSMENCPLVITQPGVKIEAVEILFTKKVDGISGNFMKVTDEKLNTQRIAIVTLRITKPEGMTLELAACDLTLHYYHGPNGTKYEAAPCEGLSAFNKTLDEDRSVNLNKGAGPGFIKMSTGVRTSQEKVVYVDAVFGYIEPDISKAWVCIAQPLQTTALSTSGWTPEP